MQKDGLHLPVGADENRIRDVDGDCLSAFTTVELMHGASVRVLIPGSTSRKVAIRMLRKMAKMIQNDPELMRLAEKDLVKFARESEIEEFPF